MIRLAVHYCLFPLMLTVGLYSTASAWEIELRPHVATTSAVVRLGDISQITGLEATDARVLEQLVLAPGPSRSYSRTLSASQIRKLLRGRGVELDACRFTGSVRTVIVHDTAARPTVATNDKTRGLATPKPNSAAKPANPWTMVRPASYRSRGGVARVGEVEQKVADVVNRQLQQLAESSSPWDVKVTISGKALRELPRQWNGLVVEGLDTAAEGHAQLTACFKSDAGDVRVPIEAVAQRMIELVVPVRPLKHGEMINASDVELRHVAYHVGQQKVARRLDEVVGRVVELPIQTGTPMPTRSVKRPILVKRREQIEVVARRGGVTIRTQVRAVDNGALGDIISVERLDNRKIRFTARVVGVQRVEVCASNASAQRIAER